MKNLSYSYKDIIKIALPLMVSNFFYTLIAVTDVGFMKEIGVAEQAAIGYTSLLYLICFMLGFSYTKGTQILIARKIGERKHQALGNIVDNTFVVIGALSAFLFIGTALFSESFLRLVISQPDVFQASYEFLSIRKWGFILSLFGTILVAYYSGIEKTLVLAVAIITMSLTNIFLNWVLIFGHFGAAPMGIKGAAWASNIAEGVSFIIMFAGIFVLKLREKHHIFYFKKISAKIIGQMSKLSAPLVVQTLVGLGAWFVFFTLIEKMGQDELAISNVVKQLYTLLGISTFALASTTNTVIGNAVGQRKYDEIIPLTKRLVIISSIGVLLLSLPAFIFPRWFIELLTEPSLVADTYQPLIVALIALQIYGVSTVLFNTIASIGSTMVTMIIEIITIVGYLIFLYIAFVRTEMSLPVVWTSEWWYWSIIGLCSLLYLAFSNWKQGLSKKK